MSKTPEHQRLAENTDRTQNWKRWGPYLSERQWGTVREDYSSNGDSWRDLPHEQSRSRAYRWGEDGLLGFTDRQCRLCFSIGLWNGQDPIIKERLFGLTGPQGNHGEDVKEYYYYLDSTPTHSYAKGLYRYPQAEYPYEQLVKENAKRSKLEPEFELVDTGIFNEGRYFDVQVEYAKEGPNDIAARITVTNQGPDQAELWLLPTLWFRNTWIWGCRHEGCSLKPSIRKKTETEVELRHESLGSFRAAFGDHPEGEEHELLFTENETNSELLFNTPTYTPYVKDAFHRYVVNGEADAINPEGRGTKVASCYHLDIPSGESRKVTFRLAEEKVDDISKKENINSFQPLSTKVDSLFEQRVAEADAFYDTVIDPSIDKQQRQVSRQAYAGLLWTKQFYHYIVKDWLDGDRDVADPPAERNLGRNHQWKHLYARDILSMPDKWEYPWFAAWDLAFHMIPMARIDPEFAKRQLLVLLREWYMHPNGQLPAYEFAFHDVNPPVHAWACFRVYQMSGTPGNRDHAFLANAFKRLLLNFTWWVNRLDESGDNVFAGGFLGLDNIGLFDRSKGLPDGARLEQSDGTAWMAFYCGNMLSMALELAREDSSYEDMASKFFDHFVRITEAINTRDGTGLWDEKEGFYFDQLHLDNKVIPLQVRSLVGLLPLIAVEVLDEELINRLPDFRGRLDWFLKYRHNLKQHVTITQSSADTDSRMLLAIPSREKLQRVLSVLLEESEFLSPYGIRSLSKRHESEPFELTIRGEKHQIAYVPGESDTYMFGGNSNWRGPIWFPTNYLLIESLESYYEFYGDSLRVECPTGSGNYMNLLEVSNDLNRRLARIFLPHNKSGRPCLARSHSPETCPDNWQGELLFYEYFNGDTGEGLGASHQTGWTALIASCIEKLNAE